MLPLIYPWHPDVILAQDTDTLAHKLAQASSAEIFEAYMQCPLAAGMINMPAKNGATPLMVAIEQDNLEVVNILLSDLQLDLDVNHQLEVREL